jgi:hypothetical protein
LRVLRRMGTTTNPDVWARLEAMLTGMHAGDVITVGQVVADTGIGVEAAGVILEGLVRADLFEQHGLHFMRVSPSGDPELGRSLGSH